jgi:CHAT domain-containing protein
VEALFVARKFGGEENTLVGNLETEMAVKAQLPKAELLHFATHGQISEESPMHSALSLANGESLSLQELTGIQLRAELVVLSACDAGRGTHTGGDDVLGLTRGLIAGGAKSAVVSLWQVNDVSTTLLMGHFYQQLKKGGVAPEALRLAQVYLSGLDKQQQSEELKKLEMSIEVVAARSLVSKVRSERGITGFKVEEEPAADYEHPYYWGAFVLVGR